MPLQSSSFLHIVCIFCAISLSFGFVAYEFFFGFLVCKLICSKNVARRNSDFHFNKFGMQYRCCTDAFHRFSKSAASQKTDRYRTIARILCVLFVGDTNFKFDCWTELNSTLLFILTSLFFLFVISLNVGFWTNKFLTCDSLKQTYREDIQYCIRIIFVFLFKSYKAKYENWHQYVLCLRLK